MVRKISHQYKGCRKEDETYRVNEKINQRRVIIQLSHRKDRRKIKYYQDILKKHNYWDTRPMLRDDKDQVEYGNIEGHRKVEEVNKDCEKLPD